MTEIIHNQKLSGQGISPGLALGKAFIFKDILQRDQQRYGIEESEIEWEYSRIERAIKQVLRDLRQSAGRVEAELNEELAAIFDAHYTVLDGSSLSTECREELEKELVNAEEVVKRVFRRWERKLRTATASMPSFPDHDVADLGRRLLRALQGLHTHSLENVPEGSVLVAARLLPSDTIHLSRQSVTAVVVGSAGPGSHAALLTRELGIPAVAQLPGVLDRVSPEETVLVDGSAGTVIIGPDTETVAVFRRHVAKHDDSVTRAHELCHDVARTQDGVRVEVMANIGCREDAVLAANNGADGVGLYRLENMFLARKVLPSETGLFVQLRHALEPFQEKTQPSACWTPAEIRRFPGSICRTRSIRFWGGGVCVCFWSTPNCSEPNCGRV